MKLKESKKTLTKYKRPIIYLALIIISLGALWFQFFKPTNFYPEDEQKIPSEKTVYIYAYNSNLDLSENDNITCEEQYVTQLERTLSIDNTEDDSPISLVEKSVELLITENLKDDEIESGFTTEYPHPEFELLSVNQEDTTVFLKFTEVPGFTTGGSCRTSILQQQIIKTAQQFYDEEIQAILLPEDTLFMP